MKLIAGLQSIALLALLTTATLPAAAADVSTPDAEGLVPAKIKGLDHVYKRPDADLSRYDKVMLDPIEVSFKKSWNPAPAGMPVTARERQEIKDGLARVLRKEFTRELARSGRYKVVDAAADDVLRIKADIRDLDVAAPDVPRAGVVRSYTMSAGEMTLVAELRDGPTGALLARIVDRYRDPESVFFERTTQIENVVAAQQAAATWARILRERLDAAHGTAGK